MPIAITEEHRQLAARARDLAERHDMLRQAQDLLDAPGGTITDLWMALAGPGLLGLHI